MKASASRSSREQGSGGPSRARALSLGLALVLVAALVGQTVRTLDRLAASTALRGAEVRTLAAVRRSGPAAGTQLRVELARLEEARRRDPGEVGIPLAIGSLYLLLGSNEQAVAAYEEALALEPRPEIYLNLGRAQLAAGRPDEARESFALAVELQPLLKDEVPPGMLPE